MAIPDTNNDNRLREIMQEPWKKEIQSLNIILVGVLQVKYQGGMVSAFELHPEILSSYVVVAAIYCFACVSSMDDRYLPVLRASVFVAGSLATTLLLMVVVPVFGWVVFVVWVMVFLVMAWRVRAEVYALIRLAIGIVASFLSG